MRGLSAALVGGSGALGHALVAEWLARGHSVRVLGRSEASARGYAELAGREGFLGFSAGAVGNPEELLPVFSERPAVCFWQVPRASAADASPREAFRRVVGEALEVVEACRAHRARLVLAGSSEVLEPYRGREKQSESWPTAARTPRAAALLAAEQLALSCDHTHGLPVSVCRVFGAYGPVPEGEEDDSVIATFARRVARGEKVKIHGDGRQSRDFVHARDVARLLAEMGEDLRVHGTVVHAASGEETRLSELGRSMSAGVGYTFVTHPAPLAEIGRMRGDPSLAARLLRWAPSVTLREGLREMRAWAAADAGRTRDARGAAWRAAS
ncbi:MAG: NAD(P)-dependent oxidoreductase [Candidatus Eisenbacteria bacterium]|nr:NAD(P)-dependent oxidoreductase [Candidatus Eisenbacteria bacterium]